MKKNRHRSIEGHSRLGRITALVAALLGLSALGACGDDGTGITGIGKACVDATECSGDLVCLTEFPDGYCSEACDNSDTCGGALCAQGICLLQCTTAASCRDGYACLNMGSERACAPRGQGYSGLGDGCSSNFDCQTEYTCEQAVAEGSQCSKTCTSVLNCGVDGVCVDGFCRHTCNSSQDCDENQSCTSTADGKYCVPESEPSGLGGPCAGDEECQSGLICLTDAPDGYCTRECSLSSQCDGGICHDGYCFTACTPGYEKVDFLFVIDDSTGMENYHPMLNTSIGYLFIGLNAAGVDYRVGIVTTDVDTAPYAVANCRNRGGLLQVGTTAGGCQPPADGWITAGNVTDPEAAFNCIVNDIGTDGCGFEQPLEAIQRALSEAVNPGFIRSDAHLVIVIVSNEDDCSAQNPGIYDQDAAEYGYYTGYRCFDYGIECDGTPESFTNCHTMTIGDGGVLHPIGRYVSQIEAVKGDLGQVSVHAISGPSSPVIVTTGSQGQGQLSSSCPGGVPTAEPSIRIQEFLTVTGGDHHSICPGFGAVWTAIANDVGGGGACRNGYSCNSVSEGDICEP